MLMVSLLFSLVILVSFDSLPTAVIASSSWATLSCLLFLGSMV